MSKKPSERNCVIEIYRGVPIRRYETLRLRIDYPTKKKLIDLALDTGLTEKKIVCNSSTPCEHCKDKFVTVFDDDDKEHKIPKGIISRKSLR